MRMITMRDVSKMIQNEKLKVNSELTDMLAATISHDMRTPLNAIITVSKNVMHDLKHQSRLKRVTERYLKIVTNSALLLSYLVNDLTDLFKIRTGRFVPYE
jgi:two-component system aerobic respiration control sensor histidine kinase ArcB